MLRKTAIISGGFGDIGKAIAEKFAQNSYNIALTYYSSFEPDFIERLKTYGVEVFAMKCDQTKENDVINFVNSVFNEFEYIDAFIATAGKAETPIELINKPSQVIEEIIDINLKGTIFFNKEIAKKFFEQKHGAIVNISSIYGISGGTLESVYSACKAGIINLTKSLASEVAPNVRVNCIAPGCIKTKMTNNLSDDDIETILEETPLKRIGVPDDIASCTLFLAGSESSFITGETLTVSGGIVKF